MPKSKKDDPKAPLLGGKAKKREKQKVITVDGRETEMTVTVRGSSLQVGGAAGSVRFSDTLSQSFDDDPPVVAAVSENKETPKLPSSSSFIAPTEAPAQIPGDNKRTPFKNPRPGNVDVYVPQGSNTYQTVTVKPGEAFPENCIFFNNTKKPYPVMILDPMGQKSPLTGETLYVRKVLEVGEVVPKGAREWGSDENQVWHFRAIPQTPVSQLLLYGNDHNRAANVPGLKFQYTGPGSVQHNESLEAAKPKVRTNGVNGSHQGSIAAAVSNGNSYGSTIHHDQATATTVILPGEGDGNDMDEPLLHNIAQSEGEQAAQTEEEKIRQLSYFKRFLILVATTVAVGAILIEPLYTSYMADDATDGLEDGLNGVSLQIGLWAAVIAKTLSWGFNLAADMGSVTPVEEADDFRQNLINPKEQDTAVKWLSRINTVLSLPIYSLLASSDAITIGRWSSEPLVKYPFGLSVLGLGDVYYLMFSSFTESAERFMEALRTGTMWADYSFSAFSTSFEILFGGGLLCSYRGIAPMAIGMELLKEYFGVKWTNNRSAFYAMMAVGALGFDIAAWSRFLPYKDSFRNPKIAALSEEVAETALVAEAKSPAQQYRDILSRTKASKLDVVTNALMALARGGSLGGLTYRHVGTSSVPGDATIAAVIGTAAFVQCYMAYHDRALKKTAFQQYEATLPAADIRQLTNPAKQVALVAEKLKTPTVSRNISILNLGAGGARLCLFFAFVYGIQSTAEDVFTTKLPFDSLDRTLFTILIGSTVQAVERANFQRNLENSIALRRAKRLIAPSQEVADKNVVSRSMSSMFTPSRKFPSERSVNTYDNLTAAENITGPNNA